MSTTCRCGAEWTGLRIEHCPACHETFTGTRAGDRHRVGDHAVSTGPNRRRCLSPDEMRERGMAQNARGVWTNGGTSPWARTDCATSTEPSKEFCAHCLSGSRTLGEQRPAFDDEEEW